MGSDDRRLCSGTDCVVVFGGNDFRGSFGVAGVVLRLKVQQPTDFNDVDIFRNVGVGKGHTISGWFWFFVSPTG